MLRQSLAKLLSHTHTHSNTHTHKQTQCIKSMHAYQPFHKHKCFFPLLTHNHANTFVVDKELKLCSEIETKHIKSQRGQPLANVQFVRWWQIRLFFFPSPERTTMQVKTLLVSCFYSLLHRWSLIRPQCCTPVVIKCCFHGNRWYTSLEHERRREGRRTRGKDRER